MSNITVDTTPTAQVINLDGWQVLRFKVGPYLVGHFRDVPALLAAAVDFGVNIADLQIINPERKGS